MAARNAFLKEVVLKNKSHHPGIVKVVWQVQGEGEEGSVVKEVADSSVYMKAVFTQQALNTFLTNYDDSFNSPPDWSHSMLLLNQFHVQFQSSAHPGNSEKKARFILVVEKFGLYNLQEGFYTKHQPKDVMEDPEVVAKAQEMERKEGHTGSIVEDGHMNTDSSPSLSMLLDQMGQADIGPKQDDSCSQSQALSESLDESQEGEMTEDESGAEDKMRCLKSEDFIISADQQAVLDSIPEWKDDYVPPPTESSDDTSSGLPFDRSLELPTLACDRNISSPQPSLSKTMEHEVNTSLQRSSSKITGHEVNTSPEPSPSKITEHEANTSIQLHAPSTSNWEAHPSSSLSSPQTTRRTDKILQQISSDKSSKHNDNTVQHMSSPRAANLIDSASLLTLLPKATADIGDTMQRVSSPRTTKHKQNSSSHFSSSTSATQKETTSLQRSPSKTDVEKDNGSQQTTPQTVSHIESEPETARSDTAFRPDSEDSANKNKHSDKVEKQTNIILHPRDQEKTLTETQTDSSKDVNYILHQNNQEPALAEATSETDNMTSSEAVTANETNQVHLGSSCESGEQQGGGITAETKMHTDTQREKLNDEVCVEEGKESGIDYVLGTKSHTDMQGEKLNDRVCFEEGREQTRTLTDSQGERLKDAVHVEEGRQPSAIGCVEKSKSHTDRQERRLNAKGYVEEGAEHRQSFTDREESSNIHTASTPQDGTENDIVPDTSDSSKSSCESSFQHPEVTFTISSPSSHGDIISSPEDGSLPVSSYQSAVESPSSPPMPAPPPTSSSGRSTETPPPPMSPFHQPAEPPPPHSPPRTGHTSGDGHTGPSGTGTCSVQGQESETSNLTSQSGHRSSKTSKSFWIDKTEKQCMTLETVQMKNSCRLMADKAGKSLTSEVGLLSPRRSKCVSSSRKTSDVTEKVNSDSVKISEHDETSDRERCGLQLDVCKDPSTNQLQTAAHQSATETSEHCPDIDISHPLSLGFMPSDFTTQTILPDWSSLNSSGGGSEVITGAGSKGGGGVMEGDTMQASQAFVSSDKKLQDLVPNSQENDGESGSCSSAAFSNMPPVDMPHPHPTNTLPANTPHHHPNTITIPHHHPHTTKTTTNTSHSISTPAHKVGRQLGKRPKNAEDFTLCPVDSLQHVIYHSTQKSQSEESQSPSILDMSAIQSNRAQYVSVGDADESEYLRLTQFTSTETDIDHLEFDLTSGKELRSSFPLQVSNDDFAELQFSADSNDHIQSPEPEKRDGVLVECSISSYEEDSFDRQLMRQAKTPAEGDSEGHFGSSSEAIVIHDSLQGDVVVISSSDSSDGTGCSTSTQDPDSHTAVAAHPPNLSGVAAQQPDSYAALSAHPTVVIISSESSGGAGCDTTSQGPDCSVIKCVDPTTSVSSSENRVDETQSCLTDSHKNVPSNAKESHDKKQSTAISCQNGSRCLKRNKESNREINSPIENNKTRLNNSVTQSPSKRNKEQNTDINSPVVSKKARLNNTLAHSPSKGHCLHAERTSSRREKYDSNIKEIQTQNVRNGSGVKRTFKISKQLETENSSQFLVTTVSIDAGSFEDEQSKTVTQRRKRVTNSPNTMLKKQPKRNESRCIRPLTLDEDSAKNCSDPESFSSGSTRLSGECVGSRQKENQSIKRPTEESVGKSKLCKKTNPHNDHLPEITRESPDMLTSRPLLTAHSSRTKQGTSETPQPESRIAAQQKGTLVLGRIPAIRETTTSSHPELQGACHVRQTDRQTHARNLGQIYKTGSKRGSGLPSRNESISRHTFRQSSRNKHSSGQSSAINTDSSSTEIENDATESDSHRKRDPVNKTYKKTPINTETVSGDGSTSDCLYTSEQRVRHIEQSPNTAKKRTSRTKQNGFTANKDTHTVLSKHKHKTNTSSSCSASHFQQNIRRRRICEQRKRQYSDSSEEDSTFELSTRRNSDISDQDSTCNAPLTAGTTHDQTDANSQAVRGRNNLQARPNPNISAWQVSVAKSKDPKQKLLQCLKLTEDFILKKVEDCLAGPNIRR